ncbi:MAG: hypothetical protein JSW73_02370 [Candidatus Woesearchaeota archaeon]|nr:MAG: hypothetical protein JSW73_02370 [Candidatus Woesearchaeota archaeon]
MQKRSLKKDVLMIILTVVFMTIFSYLILPYLPVSQLRCVSDACILVMTLVLSLMCIVISFLVAYLLFINKERKDIEDVRKFLIISVIIIIVIYLIIGLLLKGTFLEFVEEEKVPRSDLDKAKDTCTQYCNSSDAELYCISIFKVDITKDNMISYPGEYLNCWEMPISIACEEIDCSTIKKP